MRIFNFIVKFLRRFRSKNLPNKPPRPDFSETRQENTPPLRQVKEFQKDPKILSQRKESSSEPSIDRCPYCSGKNFIKSGKRRKKYESQQRYLCNDCQRSFVGQSVKGKSFPLKLILEGIFRLGKGV